MNELRDLLSILSEHENSLVRTAARLSMRELREAELCEESKEKHLRQINRLLDAVINPAVDSEE